MPKATQRVTADPKRDLPTDPEALLTKKEAAQILSVTERWMKRAAAEHLLPVYHIGGLVRFRLGDVLAYRDARRTEAVR